MSTGRTPSLRDYDAERYGPFLGVSDEGSAATAIRDAAYGSPKALALRARTPLAVGVAHDAERLGSVGEVPVGPDQYERIRSLSDGHVLMTTNVGSHVNIWHYLQPPALDVPPGAPPQDVARWAREHGAGLRGRTPQPWLRLRFDGRTPPEERVTALRAAAAEAPVCLAARAEDGSDTVRAAIEVAAAGEAAAVVVEGATQPPSEGRPALPGLLNYFPAARTRELLRAAREAGVTVEPALKIDTDSVANQIWTGLYAARAMGLHLGKYGLFPLTFQEMAEVVGKVQSWTHEWTAAPVFYADVPWVDGDRVYEVADAAEAAGRWLGMVAERGARVVLIDTVDKARGRHLVRIAPDDTTHILTWDDVEELRRIATDVGVRVLWAGGISRAQVREFGRRKVFGVYVTSAAAQPTAPGPDEREDIGLVSAREPSRERIALVKLLLEAGFLGDGAVEADSSAAEAGDPGAAQRLAAELLTRWRQRLGG